jgi:two-component system, LytTR family, sensor kinase
MKSLRWPRVKAYSFIFFTPFLLVMFLLIVYGERIWHEPKIWLINIPIGYLISILNMVLNVFTENQIEKKFPSTADSKQRIILKGIMMTVQAAVSTVFLVYFFREYKLLGYQYEPNHYWQIFLLTFLFSLIFETLYEADYIFSKYKESEAEKETIERLTLNQEFDSLKSQVNPHFLFNCFNTLSSLITVDREKAVIFLDELSKVYRYLLKNNSETISTLENELKFIESYLRLLQTRHGEAVQLNMRIDKQYHSYYLPSLTLQLLVENAVKHNALSKNYPLYIDIFTSTGNKLVVNNNLQRRAVKATSTGLGLQNIQLKYQLLKQPGFQIMEGGKNFTVVLPLIWKISDNVTRNL